MHIFKHWCINTKTGRNLHECIHSTTAVGPALKRSWLMTIDHETLELVCSNTSPQVIGAPSSPADPLWTVEDVADYLQLQPETIRSMARRGELPALKIGKVWRFQRQAIHDMLVNMY
jgi:excisionase family DNA binding protein